MRDEGFAIEIFGPEKADVYLDASEPDLPWSAVRALDAAGIRVVSDIPDAVASDARVARIVMGCVGEVPKNAAGADLDRCCAAALAARPATRPYAFFIGRLERDFRQARDAIRSAVERHAGIPLLWVDDARHRTSIDSVRERTRLLIKHATFVIADLTLGVESPERENPSRAHEIGMALAYEHPLMLASQEPRRYPYYSVADMQMTFWSAEDELERAVREWIYANRESVARRVLNFELGSVFPAHTPVVRAPAFAFDPARRYIGPRTRTPLDVRRLLDAVRVRLS